MNLIEIENEIFSRKGKNGNSKYFYNIAHEMEYNMLLEKSFSNELFQLYMRIFTDECLLLTKGINWFMFHIYNDFSKINPNQRKEFKKTIVDISNLKMSDDFKFVLLDTFLRKFNLEDMKDLKALYDDIHFYNAESDIYFAVNEMIERYESGLMKDIN